MDKQKLVVILLVVAIVLSAINLIVSLGVDVGDFRPVTQTIIKGTDIGAGQVGFEIITPGSGQ